MIWFFLVQRQQQWLHIASDENSKWKECKCERRSHLQGGVAKIGSHTHCLQMFIQTALRDSITMDDTAQIEKRRVDKFDLMYMKIMYVLVRPFG